MRSISPNYDLIAADYNRRYQQNRRQGTLNALRRILSEESPEKVLEVGCGTCHWLALLSNAAQYQVVGVDKSFKMLRQADPTCLLQLCQGTAENIPLINEAFDFIFCVNAIHHFSEPEWFISQAFRLLKSEGTLAVIGMNPRDPRNKWYIYGFFDGTLTTDLNRFPDWPQVRRWMKNTGFVDIHQEDVDFIHDPKTRETVLRDPFLEKTACSQLALLSQRQYQKGLEKLKEHVRTNPDPFYHYENTIVLTMIQTHKP